jgi:predicted protein tyrosine phosphatase
MSRFAVFVCAKADVNALAWRVTASHLLSLLNADDRIARPSLIDQANHLEIAMSDEDEPTRPGAPTRGQVEAILAFGRSLPDDATLIVNCHGGICRSTAAALALLTQKLGADQAGIDDAVRHLRASRPRAMPNSLITRFADELLGAEGRLVAAAEAQAQRALALRFG